MTAHQNILAKDIGSTYRLLFPGYGRNDYQMQKNTIENSASIRAQSTTEFFSFFSLQHNHSPSFLSLTPVTIKDIVSI